MAMLRTGVGLPGHSAYSGKAVEKFGPDKSSEKFSPLDEERSAKAAAAAGKAKVAAKDEADLIAKVVDQLEAALNDDDGEDFREDLRKTASGAADSKGKKMVNMKDLHQVVLVSWNIDMEVDLLKKFLDVDSTGESEWPVGTLTANIRKAVEKYRNPPKPAKSPDSAYRSIEPSTSPKRVELSRDIAEQQPLPPPGLEGKMPDSYDYNPAGDYTGAQPLPLPMPMPMPGPLQSIPECLATDKSASAADLPSKREMWDTNQRLMQMLTANLQLQQPLLELGASCAAAGYYGHPGFAVGMGDPWNGVPGYAGGAAYDPSWSHNEDKGNYGKKKATDEASTHVKDEDKTTVMLRNLPNDYKRADLLHMLDSKGFKGKYDFVYLPTDFRRFAGLGYAFVNLITPEVAREAMEEFKGFGTPEVGTWRVQSRKVCATNWGEPLQGLQAHLDRYKNSPVMHENVPEEHKPQYYQNGELQPFPAHTKRIRPPRVKRNPGGDSAADGDMDTDV